MAEFISQFDTSFLHAAQAVGPAWQFPAWLLSTVIASTEWLAPILIVTLLLIGKKRAALEMFVIFAVSALVIFGLKHFIEAPRPFQIDASVVQYSPEEDGYGMPSGHAFMSVVILGWLWLRHPRSVILTSGALAIVLLVGLARVYLGVHYPSQVFAGWILGGLFFWLFWWLDRFLFRPRSSYIKRDKTARSRR
jgi:membrane-associated phospholipid phosphatase